MNFVQGKIEAGRFRGAGIDLEVTGVAENGDTTLGFRPEDAEVVDAGQGLFDAVVYAVEMTGEQTLVTIELDEAYFVIKMPKDYETDINSQVGVRFADEHGYLFNTVSGARLRNCAVVMS